MVIFHDGFQLRRLLFSSFQLKKNFRLDCSIMILKPSKKKSLALKIITLNTYGDKHASSNLPFFKVMCWGFTNLIILTFKIVISKISSRQY